MGVLTSRIHTDWAAKKSSTLKDRIRSLSGFGRVKPRRVWFGGDSSTVFFDLTWRDWGHHIAYASGRSYYQPPYVHTVLTHLTVSDIGVCGARRTYLKIGISEFINGRWIKFRHTRSLC